MAQALDDFELDMKAALGASPTPTIPTNAAPTPTSTSPFDTALTNLNNAFQSKWGRPFTITGDSSGLHGIHKRLYAGNARDVRTRDLTPEQQQWLLDTGPQHGLRVRDLRTTWKSVGGSGPHFHVDLGDVGKDEFELDMMQSLPRYQQTQAPTAKPKPYQPPPTRAQQLDQLSSQLRSTPGAIDTNLAQINEQIKRLSYVRQGALDRNLDEASRAPIEQRWLELHQQRNDLLRMKAIPQANLTHHTVTPRNARPPTTAGEDIISSAAESLGLGQATSLLTGGLGAGYDLAQKALGVKPVPTYEPRPQHGPIMSTVEGLYGMAEAQVAEFQKAQQLAQQRGYKDPRLALSDPEVLGHFTAAILPIFGPQAAQVGEELGRGEYGKATGHGIGLFANMLVGGEAFGKQPVPKFAPVGSKGLKPVKLHEAYDPFRPKGRPGEFIPGVEFESNLRAVSKPETGFEIVPPDPYLTPTDFESNLTAASQPENRFSIVPEPVPTPTRDPSVSQPTLPQPTSRPHEPHLGMVQVHGLQGNLIAEVPTLEEAHAMLREKGLSLYQSPEQQFASALDEAKRVMQPHRQAVSAMEHADIEAELKSGATMPIEIGRNYPDLLQKYPKQFLKTDVSSAIEAPTTPLEPLSFSDSISQIASTIPSTRRVGEKVFISDVWEALRKSDPNFANVSLDDFKTALLNEHQRGTIQLARADLAPSDYSVGAKAVERSAIKLPGGKGLQAQFHTVRVPEAPAKKTTKLPPLSRSTTPPQSETPYNIERRPAASALGQEIEPVPGYRASEQLPPEHATGAGPIATSPYDVAPIPEAPPTLPAPPKKGRARKGKQSQSQAQPATQPAAPSSTQVEQVKPVPKAAEQPAPVSTPTPQPSPAQVAPVPSPTVPLHERAFPQQLEEHNLPGGPDRLYPEISHEQAWQLAQERLQTLGAEKADRLVRNEAPGAVNTKTGAALIKLYHAQGEVAKANDMAGFLSARLTETGQASAAADLGPLSPEGALIGAHRLASKNGKIVTPEIASSISKDVTDFSSIEARLTELESQLKQKPVEAPAAPAAPAHHSNYQPRRARTGQFKRGKPKLPETEQIPSSSTGWLSNLEQEALAARARRTERSKTGERGALGDKPIGPEGAAGSLEDLRDMAIIGAAKIARAGMDLATWTNDMVREFGEQIRPHLRQLYAESYKLYLSHKEADKQNRLRARVEKQAQFEGETAYPRRPLTKQQYANAELEYRDLLRQRRKTREHLASTYESLQNGEGIGSKILGAINLTKALKFSLDASEVLRQGAMLWTKPGRSFEALKRDLASRHPTRGREAYEALQREISNHPRINQFRATGLELVTQQQLLPNAGLWSREEAFQTPWAERIPGVAGSERGYNSFLDWQRVGAADDFFTELETSGGEGLLGRGEGLDFNNPQHRKAFDDMAKVVNMMTGRASVPEKLKGAMVLLNTPFISPRFAYSRLQAINPAFYLSLHPAARRIAIRKAAQFYFTTGSAVGLLALVPGVNTNLDPRDSDFLKVRIGDTRYDPWAGTQQYITLLGKLADDAYTAYKPASNQHDRDSASKAKSKMAEHLGAFLRAKLSPVAQLGASAITGQTMRYYPENEPPQFGKKLAGTRIPMRGHVTEEILRTVIPVMVEDFYDAFHDLGFRKGLKQILIEAPNTAGLGAQTYKTGKQRQEERRQGVGVAPVPSAPVAPVPQR